MTQCAWPNCENEGTFPAPINPRNLRERQYFCQQHIREFNKQWNGLAGFNPLEINALHDTAVTWLRPTRPLGENPNYAADLHFETADELRKFFEKRTQVAAARNTTARKLPPDVEDACAIMALPAPLAEQPLKRHYLKLMKEHHPDKHGGASEAEEFVKKLNVAYQILQTWQANNPVEG